MFVAVTLLSTGGTGFVAGLVVKVTSPLLALLPPLSSDLTWKWYVVAGFRLLTLTVWLVTKFASSVVVDP